MTYMINHPRIFCFVCLIGMWAMARFGSWIRARFKVPEQEGAENLNLVVPATLTLLGLIIGFTFSMATTRYDQRKLFEEGEANAIGTEWVRAELLPASETAQVHTSLLAYLDHRIAFYHVQYGSHLAAVDSLTTQMQSQLWSEVVPQAEVKPDPVTALIVSGMNDVLNSQGYTQFSWWNRIPSTAWGLMVLIALAANFLVGYATRRSRDGKLMLWVLPVLVSIAFFLIADIDSPRGGIIRVAPMDLMALSQQLHAGSK
jgi:hypothetical protein